MLRLMSWYWSISDFVALSQIGLTLIVGAHWITTGDLTVGMLFAFLAYLGIMLWPVRQMGRILTELGKTTVALTRIHEILSVEREADAEIPADAPLPETLAGHLVARNLRFSPDGLRPAIDGLSFEIRPGAIRLRG